MVTIGPLGSGSRGNALIVSAGEESIAVDAGFSRREMLARIAAHGLSPETLRAVLITHEHTDHTSGCRLFCDELGIPACMTPGTNRILEKRHALPQLVRQFSPGMRFHIGNFAIDAFSVPHDATEPVGFVIEYGNVRIGIATDLGQVNNEVIDHLRNCDALVLESNYDPQMLADSDRRLELKRRIAGPVGHLENAAAAKALDVLTTERTKLVLLAHISSECNLPELVAQQAGRHLDAKHLRWEIISQEGKTPSFDL